MTYEDHDKHCVMAFGKRLFQKSAFCYNEVIQEVEDLENRKVKTEEKMKTAEEKVYKGM